jgi:hypothetical protein
MDRSRERLSFWQFDPVELYASSHMSNLHSQLSRLAASFAESVLAAVRASSLEELLAESHGGRAAGAGLKASAPPVARRTAATPAKHSGRLARRSPEQIAKTVDRVVAAVKKRKDGLRAEQIRVELGLQAKEMPRVLKEALAAKKLTAKGQKRATTYFAR